MGHLLKQLIELPVGRPLIFAWALAWQGCDWRPSAEVRAEAGIVSRAIDVLREAPNEAKSVHLGELRQLSCVQPAVCNLKAKCEAAYSMHVAGLGQAQAARVVLGHDDPAALTQSSVALAEAQRMLQQAHQLAQECVSEQAALRRSFKLH